jgi:hypothetical protein
MKIIKIIHIRNIFPQKYLVLKFIEKWKIKQRNQIQKKIILLQKIKKIIFQYNQETLLQF